jgi:hypothetical protein
MQPRLDIPNSRNLTKSTKSRASTPSKINCVTASVVSNGPPGLIFTIIETQVYEKRGDRWLMISHHASRVPD